MSPEVQNRGISGPTNGRVQQKFKKNKENFTCLLVQFTEQRLATLPACLCTQTGSHCLIIQVLNTRVYFLNV